MYIFGGMGPAGALDTTHKYHTGRESSGRGSKCSLSANSPRFPGFIFSAVGVIALGLYQHEAKRCGCLSAGF